MVTPITLGATLIALAVPAHHHSHRPGCQTLFTIPMAQRAARATYRGTKDVSLKEYKFLGRVEMCQRNPRAHRFVRWYDRRQRALWRDRLEANAAPALSSLARCIINAESGGDPNVVNSSGHMGYGQWDESTWLADGGGRYGRTPLDATPAEQERIIEEQVAKGNTAQWTDYDPC